MSEELKLTTWFPATVMPARVGVYEVEPPSGYGRWYAYWDGERFGYRVTSGPDEAEDCRSWPTRLPTLASWRGLAKNPAPGATPGGAE